MAASKPNDKHESTIVKRGGGKHQHDEHGGAWKVAFADFCLALMALFLVLWLIAARESQNLKRIVRDAAENGLMDGVGIKPGIGSEPDGSMIERFELLRIGSGGQSAAGNPDAPQTSYESPTELAALSKALGELSTNAGLESNLATVVTPFGLRVMLHDTDAQGMFMRGSALPTGRFARLLQKMGPLFAQMKNQMLIVGHTDGSRFAGPDDGQTYSNWALSNDRALSARAQLLAGGMRAESVLQVVGMADQAPLTEHEPLADKNRRIELLILTSAQSRAVIKMFGATAPGLLIGNPDTIGTEQQSALDELRGAAPKTP